MKPHVISGLLLLAAGTLAHAATYSFGTSAEYDANFREVSGGSVIGHNAAGYLSNTGRNQTVVVAYDTDGAAGAGTTLYPITLGTTLNVSADVRFSHAGSFGFYFSAVGGGTTYLALLNPTTGNDQFRFFSEGVMSTGAAGNQDFTNTSTNPVNLNNFTNISASFQVLTANSLRISLTAGGQTFSHDYTGITLPSQVEIAFRSYNPDPSDSPPIADIDNFMVTDPIPEPSALGLVGLGLFGLAARRRR